MMIHQAQGFAMGPASEMKKMASTLDKLDGQISKVYADRTHRKAATFAAKMVEETWYTADEAKAERLVDNVRPNKKRPSMGNFAPEVLKRISKHPERIAALLVVDAGPDDPPADLNSEGDDAAESPLNVAPVVVVDTSVELAKYAARVAELQL
jgi:chorismate mutase